METRPAEHWDRRYREDDLPWDVRRPEPRLIELIEQLDPPSRIALDLGCGTGDNAMELARRRFTAVGVDVAGRAVELARRRAEEGGLDNVRFECASVLEPLPVTPETAGVAVDRGCFHTLGEADRQTYARRVSEALAPGGWWLLLSGNADEDRAEGEEGPPQMAAMDVVQAVEPAFQIHRLERSRFTGSEGQPGALAWRGVFQRR
jgi:SAM-dependent methyltransferase